MSIQDIIDNTDNLGTLLSVNAKGGMKFDNKKYRPGLMLKSMPDATKEVMMVLEYGAQKYSPDNWALVETERYEEAMLRHALSYLSGEELDEETKRKHLAHAVCCMMFIMQKEFNEMKGEKE